MLCPLCETRRAKRACPALGRQICAVCCGTKRLTEIPCPADCPYLASAREHPPAATVRRQRHDVGFVMQFVRDFSERQSRLFVLIATFLVRAGAERDALQPLIDEDVADAMRSLASTYETSVRGVIYEHRPASLPAQRVVSGLTPLLADAGKSGGTAFERDAAVVMRRLEQAVAEVRASDPANRRVFLELLERIFSKAAEQEAEAAAPPDEPRLIVP
ncbi:MAG TPA: hypothetical protein VFA27_08660 [Vicinamibacterales bacterium]|nr:hypothetical protein [Vicinamibacterales bacterium]